MDRTDGSGAAAAAEYFLGLYAYAMQTGDFTEWDSMSTSMCTFCAAIRKDAGEIADDELSYSGGAISVTKTAVGPYDESFDAYPVKTSITQKPSRQIDKNGTVVVEEVGESGAIRVEVINRPAGWGILEIVPEGS